MDFFLTSALVRYEVYLLTAGLVYIAFHVLYSWGLFLVRIRAIFGIGKKRNDALTETPIQNDFGPSGEFAAASSVQAPYQSEPQTLSAAPSAAAPSESPVSIDPSRPDVV